MSSVEMEVDAPPVEGVEEGVVEQEQEEFKPFSLKVLSLIKEQQQKHGLRHADYQRYRGYCSRRLRRIRKAVGLVQGKKKEFHKKEVTEEVMKEEKHLHIPLVTAERAWAYYMQLKFESNSDPRKKFHMVNRLRKARKYAGQLADMCAESEKVDARTKLETQAYYCWLTGTLFFETSKWADAQSSLTQAKTIYANLSQAVGEEEGNLFKAKMDEITPSLRYCAYNIGDKQAASELTMDQRMDLLIMQTREQQASTLQDVEWRGRKMAVKHEKVRLFLLSYQESENELARAGNDSEAKTAVYETLLLDCKDALQALKDDLVEDPEFRARQQASSGKVTASHFLYTHLQYIRHSITLARNTELINIMKAQLEGKIKVEEGKKVVKAQDVVRMYENMIQTLGEVPLLPGLEEDELLVATTKAKMTAYKAFRAYYIAQAFIASQKWGEAMGVFQRSLKYLSEAKKDSNLEDALSTELAELETWIEGRQFVAHANSILETEAATDKMAGLEMTDTKESGPLISRLDHYYEDPGLAKGKASLVTFPPEFAAIPCKPLFYDLALYHVTMPSLDEKLEKGKSGESGGAGLGSWLGGWGWGSKK